MTIGRLGAPSSVSRDPEAPCSCTVSVHTLALNSSIHLFVGQNRRRSLLGMQRSFVSAGLHSLSFKCYTHLDISIYIYMYKDIYANISQGYEKGTCPLHYKMAGISCFWLTMARRARFIIHVLVGPGNQLGVERSIHTYIDMYMHIPHMYVCMYACAHHAGHKQELYNPKSPRHPQQAFDEVRAAVEGLAGSLLESALLESTPVLEDSIFGPKYGPRMRAVALFFLVGWVWRDSRFGHHSQGKLFGLSTSALFGTVHYVLNFQVLGSSTTARPKLPLVPIIFDDGSLKMDSSLQWASVRTDVILLIFPKVPGPPKYQTIMAFIPQQRISRPFS